MLRVALLLLAVVAASAVDCSVTCQHHGVHNFIKVTHDTTTGHTHHRCYTADHDAAVLVCTCDCCDDTVNDCSDDTNYFAADTDCEGEWQDNAACTASCNAGQTTCQNTQSYVHTALQAGTGAACPYAADAQQNTPTASTCPYDCVGHFTATMYVHTTVQAGTGSACPYIAGTANLCSCANGSAATCTTNGATDCASCTGNYQLDSNNQCTCTGNFHISAAGTCDANVCTCNNGYAVANSACTSHNANQCDHCNAKSYGSHGNGVAGNQCTVCEGNDGNALGCVNGDYHRCTSPGGDGTKSATPTWCDHCNAKSYGSHGNGVEGNQCAVCEGNDGNALGCVNGDYHRCTSPGGDGTKSATPVWCDHCNTKSYGSHGNGVEGNQCTVCEGNENNVLGCVNGDYHVCTSPGGDGTKSATPVWCDHCNTKSYGSLGRGVEGNQCTVCEGNENNKIGCVNGDYHVCTTPGGDQTKSATPVWCDHCTPGSTWGGNGSLGRGVEGNQCQPASCPTVVAYNWGNPTHYPGSSADNYYNYCNTMITATCSEMCTIDRNRCRDECNKYGY